MSREQSNKSNDLGIENAISIADLDMALYYLLDQVSTLEIFMIGILEYFELKAKGYKIPEDYLGPFLANIHLVENYMKSED